MVRRMDSFVVPRIPKKSALRILGTLEDNEFLLLTVDRRSLIISPESFSDKRESFFCSLHGLVAKSFCGGRPVFRVASVTESTMSHL